jgi:hypothetical protein
MGGQQSRQNLVSRTAIHAVEGGAAEGLAGRAGGNGPGLTVAEQKQFESSIANANIEQLATGLDLIGATLVHRAKMEENNPILQEATYIARAASNAGDQLRMMRERAGRMGVRQAHTIGQPKLCKRYAQAIAGLFRRTLGVVPYKTELGVGLGLGWEKVVFWKACSNAGFLDPGTYAEPSAWIRKVVCVGAGAGFLVCNKELTNQIRKHTGGYYDNDPVKKVQASALYWQTAKVVARHAIPNMSGLHQLQSSLNYGGHAMGALDAALEFLANVPTSPEGMVNASIAVAHWTKMKGQAAAAYVAAEVVRLTKEGVRVVKKAAKYMHVKAIEAREFAQEKVVEAGSWAINKLTSGLRLLQDNYRQNLQIAGDYAQQHRLPRLPDENVLDLDMPERPQHLPARGEIGGGEGYVQIDN